MSIVWCAVWRARGVRASPAVLSAPHQCACQAQQSCLTPAWVVGQRDAMPSGVYTHACSCTSAHRLPSTRPSCALQTAAVQRAARRQQHAALNCCGYTCARAYTHTRPPASQSSSSELSSRSLKSSSCSGFFRPSCRSTRSLRDRPSPACVRVFMCVVVCGRAGQGAERRGVFSHREVECGGGGCRSRLATPTQSHTHTHTHTHTHAPAPP
jgi:hypothetical protein